MSDTFYFLAVLCVAVAGFVLFSGETSSSANSVGRWIAAGCCLAGVPTLLFFGYVCRKLDEISDALTAEVEYDEDEIEEVA